MINEARPRTHSSGTREAPAITGGISHTGSVTVSSVGKTLNHVRMISGKYRISVFFFVRLGESMLKLKNIGQMARLKTYHGNIMRDKQVQIISQHNIIILYPFEYVN